jgi:hypothetical protein
MTSYIGLLGSYLHHAISTFNTFSQGPTHWSLTNTCSDYNLVGVSLPHHTPRPSQLTVLHFLPKSPARSQVNQSIKFQLNQEVINPNSHEWDPPFDFYRTLSSKHSIANSKPPKGGLTRKYRKVDHNASTTPYNSYVLNAQPKYNIKQDSKIKDKEHWLNTPRLALIQI